MKFQLLLAGKIVEIESNYRTIYDFCSKYILRNSVYNKPDISVRITREDIEKELFRLKVNTADANVIVNESFIYSPEYIETVIAYRKIADAMLASDTVVIHGTVISTENLGYMFAGPQGIGKTTRTRVWFNAIPGSLIVNGDKPLVKICENGVFAYGTPWCGKEGINCNTVVPLHAVFFIERADESGTIIVEELPTKEVFSTLIPQVYFPENPEAVQHVFELIMRMRTQVKFYRFKSEPTAEAIKIAYRQVCTPSKEKRD